MNLKYGRKVGGIAGPVAERHPKIDAQRRVNTAELERRHPDHGRARPGPRSGRVSNFCRPIGSVIEPTGGFRFHDY